MKIFKRVVWKTAGLAVLALLLMGLAAPYIAANQYGARLQEALSRSLGRRVEVGTVHFSLFTGPGFTVSDVKIYEDPSVGLEPFAYVTSLTVRPSFLTLLGGRFRAASVRLDDASINLTNSGSSSEWGRWNFESIARRDVMSLLPAIHVRNGRINFKFGYDKSVFYLTETDLDITPPATGSGGWRVSCEARPARTDRPGQGLGSFTAKGQWWVNPERVDLNLVVDRVGLGEITALLKGQPGGVHGTLTSRLHLAGPIDAIGIDGRLSVSDVHRWDLLGADGSGWTFKVGGKVNLPGQQFELDAASSAGQQSPLSVHLRAANYLANPTWDATLNWNRFPIEPIVELGRHMGGDYPAGLKLAGTVDGNLRYTSGGALEGEMAFRDTALTVPDSPAVTFEQARVRIAAGHVYLDPAVLRAPAGDQASVQADWTASDGALDLDVSSARMHFDALHAQAVLAAVPLLERFTGGTWNGRLHYRREATAVRWSGKVSLEGTSVEVPGLSAPVELGAARATLDGARVVVEGLQAKAGGIAFTGGYRYEPGSARPHRLQLVAGEVKMADVETVLGPSLRRGGGFLARALGRVRAPEWLEHRGVDGTLRVAALTVAGARLEDVRAHLAWDGMNAELQILDGSWDEAPLTGRLSVNLHGVRPVYRFEARLKGLAWQSGKVDIAGVVNSSGSGAELLANLKAEGTFSGSGMDLGAPVPVRTMSGAFRAGWLQGAPKLRFSNLSLHAGEDVYTGQGETREDGNSLVQLSSGTHEFRLSGPLSKLRVEEPSPK